MQLALYLLAVLSPDGTTLIQQRVDELVRRCNASKVIRLVAQDESRVLVTLPSLPANVTDAGVRQFTCVLEGMKAMPDLSFGFLGNEEESAGS